MVTSLKQPLLPRPLAPLETCQWEKFEGKNLAGEIKLPGVDPATLTPANNSLSNYEKAVEACDEVASQCNGIVEMKSLGYKMYKLRGGMFPHNMVLQASNHGTERDPVTGQIKMVTTRRFLFPKRTTYIRNCPGQMGGIHAYHEPMVLNVNHTYRFEIHFTVRHLLMLFLLLASG